MKKLLKAVLSAVSAVYTVSLAGMNVFAADAESTADTAVQSPNSYFTLIISFVFMFAILYFMAIRPQKKREEELKNMQNSIEIGDEIVTNGGIVGIVIRKAEDTLVIETGGERNKIRIKTWAVSENVSAAERAKAAEPKKSANTPLAAAGLSQESTENKKKKNKKSDEE